jgi:hypothetical protein
MLTDSRTSAFGLTSQPGLSQKQLLENVLNVLEFARQVAEVNQSAHVREVRHYPENCHRLQGRILLARQRLQRCA